MEVVVHVISSFETKFPLPENLDWHFVLVASIFAGGKFIGWSCFDHSIVSSTISFVHTKFHFEDQLVNWDALILSFDEGGPSMFFWQTIFGSFRIFQMFIFVTDDESNWDLLSVLFELRHFAFFFTLHFRRLL